MKTNLKKPTKETRSHHVKTRCHMPACQAVGCDIKCHLRVHINNVSGQAEIMHLGKRKFVTSANNPEIRGKKPRTRRKQWCPVAGCKTICRELDKQLLRAHQMTIGSVPYKMCKNI